MLDLFDLNGKVAVITGGNGGLGLGIAKGLAKAGAAVAIVGRNAEKLNTATAELEAMGARVLPVQADVSVEEDVERMVRETVAGLGRIDILFNNAAISWAVKPEEMSLELWNKFMAVDLTSVFLCAKACYPEMKKAGGGKIINVGSAITKKGFGKLVHYAAAKGGMDHMTQSLARAWGPDNIQVNALLPGYRQQVLRGPLRHAGGFRGHLDSAVQPRLRFHYRRHHRRRRRPQPGDLNKE